MGGKITIGLGIVATIMFNYIGATLFWVTLGAAVLTFWSVGVMHNFAMDSARARRMEMIQNMIFDRADDNEISRIKRLPINISADLGAVPNWLTWLNMIFSIATSVLFAIAIYKGVP